MFQTNAAFLLITILPPGKGENETYFGKLEDRINTEVPARQIGTWERLPSHPMELRTEEGKDCAEGQHVHVQASAKGDFAENIQIRLKEPKPVGFCPQQVLEYLYGTLDEGHCAIVPAGLEELIDIIHRKKTKITKLISLRFEFTAMEIGKPMIAHTWANSSASQKSTQEGKRIPQKATFGSL